MTARRPSQRAAALPPPRTAAVTVLSSTVPGRVRLRVPGLQGRHRMASTLAERLSADTGVRDVRANAVTGSLLVRFDPAHLDPPRLTDLVRRHSRALGNGGNGHHPEETAWHTLSATDVARRLATSAELGLSSAEAGGRLDTVGSNRLPMPQPKTPLDIVAGHVSSLPVVLLAGAAALSLLSGAALEAVAIAAVIIANGTIGYLTERRVERILTSLQDGRELRALVRRDGVGGLTWNTPTAVSRRGDIVVGFGNAPGADPDTLSFRAWLWTERTDIRCEKLPGTNICDLGTLDPGGTAEAWGVNDHGQVVGTACSPTGFCRAFLWERGKMKDLDQMKGQYPHLLLNAMDINNRGQITGRAMVNPTTFEAFVATPRERH